MRKSLKSLMRLSKYVGVYYPGENLDSDIKLYLIQTSNLKIQIESFEEDARFKLIYNKCNLIVFNFFKSLERPKFNHNKKYYFSK